MKTLILLSALLFASVASRADTVHQGSTVVATVTADGTAPFTCEWRKDNVVLAGQTAASYTATNIQPAQSGTYTVKVSNSAGSTTASVVLTVTPTVVPPSNGKLTFKEQLIAWLKKYFPQS